METKNTNKFLFSPMERRMQVEREIAHLERRLKEVRMMTWGQVVVGRGTNLISLPLSHTLSPSIAI